MPESVPLLEIRNLSVGLRSQSRDVVVVDRFSLRIEAGEVLGLVGESGCGKSITALAMMRLLPPAARIAGGSIRLAGDDIAGTGERRLRTLRGRRMAMIFQDPMNSLNPVQTIGWQISEPLAVHLGLGRDAARRRALELLDQVRVPAAASRLGAYPHELSGGLRQRVMIAIAISCNPQLLIADEPTTALDVTIQAQIIELLRELQRASGMAVIIITHDLGVVADFADRVAVMYAGRLIESGPVERFFAEPRHPYTEALLASLPDPDDTDRELTTIEGTVPRPSELPPGCRFAPRCGFRRPVCETMLPELWPLEQGQSAACLRPFGYAAPAHG